MNSKTLATLGVALSTLITAQAFAAAPGPLTRSQVEVERVEALRSGQAFDTAADRSLAEAYPSRHPAPAASGKTRAQVKAELAEAIRTGEYFDTALDAPLKQAYPANY